MKISHSFRILLLATFCTFLNGQSLEVFTDASVPQVNLVISELESTLDEQIRCSGVDSLNGLNTPAALVMLFPDDQLKSKAMSTAGARGVADIKPEGFSIRKTSKNGKTMIWLVAADKAGLLYGGYEIAEQIRCYGLKGVRETDQNPYMAMRGTKFNIPLDARSPSYTDASDAAQMNIGEMWSFEFWKNYIESLAHNRYNYISCWSLHPFPSLVKVPTYEKVALEDVHRSTVRWKEHYSLEGIGLDDPEILDNVEILKRMTIEEKIAFWRKVMAYAKLHNIDFYFITWNIFTNGIDGKYGITDDEANPVTRDYFRKSVKQMFLTYPDLKGIGLTTGENMHDSTFEEKEDWAYETYAKGVLDAAKEQPGRKITFVHRQHMAGALEIAEKFKPLIDHPDIEFIYSFKYAKAHVYSSTRQTYHQKFVEDIQDKGELKTIWTLRNDDVFHFRWGAPDFVREFIENIPYDVSRGYYYGSDQYIWGREFLSRDPQFPRQIEIDKHWYQWMLWGRLGYDPKLSNDRIESILQSRYHGVDATKLFRAWQEASMIYPKTTGFHWGPLDFQWYIEACQGRPLYSNTPNGFHDINRFITLKPHAGTDYISIPDYVKAHTAGRNLSGTTPFHVAEQIHAHSDSALNLLDELTYTGNRELRQTLDDIRTIAWLGKYYAHKIEAATELALFRTTLDTDRRDASIAHLNKAATFWRSYAALALSNNVNPLWTNRVGHVDWKDIFQSTLYDIRSVGGDVQLPSMEASSGGVILEAELASSEEIETISEISGYTGTGYIEMNRDNKNPDITWTCEAGKAGRFVLELRYINPWDRKLESPVSINGAKAGLLTLWETGKGNNWVWDRILVDLNKGTNQIRIHGGGKFYIDHLNVIPCDPQMLSAGVGAKNEMGEPIKELVAKAFPEGKVFIGGTTHHSRIEEASGKIIANEFDYLTPANAFKQTYIHPQPDVYDYASPDDFIVYGKASDMLMRLHAPISPQCSTWAKEDSRTADELTLNLEEYLIALYKRYAGIGNVRWVDVVNETIVPETGDWMMPKKGTGTWENPWPKIGFDESHPLRPPLYIKQAFEIANKHAANLQLIINQHGQLEPEGWETMKALVGYLRDNGLRVDGVGWQAHVYLGWEKEPGNVRRLGEIIRWCHDNNLEFHITEFNVFLRGEDKGKFEQQADTFEAITRTVLDNRTGGVVGINFWHMADPEPQKKLQGCLFDGNHSPKPAYFRIKQLLESYAGNP